MGYREFMGQAFGHQQAGRLAEAEPLFRKAHLADRTQGDPLQNLALIAAATGRMDEAIGHFERSLERKPDDLLYLRNFAVALAKSRRPADGVRSLAEARRALALAPTDPTIVQVFAQAAGAAGQQREAAQAWQWVAQRALPNDPVVHFNVGINSELAGLLGAAVDGYAAAVRLKPDYVQALVNFGSLLWKVGRTDEALALLARARQRLAERARQPGPAHAGDAAVYTTLLFTAQYPAPDDPADQLELHRDFDRHYCAAIRPLPPVARYVTPRDASARRLRVGYVSSDLRTHSVATFFEPLLAAHDRQRVEIHCFSTSSRPDATTARMQAMAERWHDAAALDDDALARRVRDAGIDVLIDLNGHTDGNRLTMFARRPAPLQLTYLGYPNTTGMASIDGRITDAVADPPGTTEAFHAERLLRMPGTFAVFKPSDEAPPVAPTPARVSGFPTLACVAALVKVNASALDPWADALRRLPAARMLFVGKGYDDPVVQARFARQFRDRDVDASRVEYVGRLPFKEYIALHARIDLVLDTFPFNGHTTTVQNLWQGVSVLTMAGVSHRSRMGASVLTCLGLQELVATDPADYAERIVRLASDVDRLAEIRAGLRGRMLASPVMDAPRFARDFEDLIFGAWGERVADLPTTAPR